MIPKFKDYMKMYEHIEDYNDPRTKSSNYTKGESFLEKIVKGSYTLNDDGTIDVVGDVKIYRRSIRNLQNFPFRTIGGDLIIEDTDLRDLKGLEHLEEVGGNLYINDNRSLISLNGLNNLRHVEGSFNCCTNKLFSLEGLESLTYVGGDFWCARNKIINLDDLRKLRYVGGKFVCSEQYTNSHEMDDEYMENFKERVRIVGNVYNTMQRIYR